jgi:hypothetical protein
MIKRQSLKSDVLISLSPSDQKWPNGESKNAGLCTLSISRQKVGKGKFRRFHVKACVFRRLRPTRLAWASAPDSRRRSSLFLSRVHLFSIWFAGLTAASLL